MFGLNAFAFEIADLFENVLKNHSGHAKGFSSLVLFCFLNWLD